jgi:hypothetical protein
VLFKDSFGTEATSSDYTFITNGCQTTAASAPACNETAPSGAPFIYSIVPAEKNSVLLKFTEASGSVDKYILEFGTKSGIYTYGLPNIGRKGTINFQVRFLKPGVNYYFRVRAGNGCATGPWSNELRGSTRGINLMEQNNPLVPQKVHTSVPSPAVSTPVLSPTTSPVITPIPEIPYSPPAPQLSIWEKLLHFFGFR